MRGRKPEEIKRSKPKFIISGESGVGKSFYMLDFPKPFIIDTEGGTVEPQYVKKMKEVDAVYFGKEDGSQDFKTVIDELKWLATNKHDRQTLIIDSFSKLYNITAAIAEETVGNIYAADKKAAQKPTRQLQVWMDRLDMTIALVAHSKAEWKNGQPTGRTTWDGWDKLTYDLNLWIELVQNGKRRDIVVRKSRIEGLILGNSYPADYETFAKLYGDDIINKPSEQIVLATVDQVAEAKHLIGVFNISEEDQKKALKKYDVEAYEELSSEEIQKVIDNLKSKLTKGAN